MLKAARAPCPVCGREVFDPAYSQNRERRTTLRCSNCHNRLVWVRAWMDRWTAHLSLILLAAVLVLLKDLIPAHTHTLRQFDSYLPWIFGALALVRYGLDKMGAFPPTLKVAASLYKDRDTAMASAKDLRQAPDMDAELKMKRRSLLPSFLRKKNALPLEDPARFGPSSET